ncbi:MAG: M43 family zinc metalloprotease, partial [Planctomycetota bacterium]
MARKKTSSRKKQSPQNPKRRMCGTMGMHFKMLETDPGYRKRRMECESHCQDMMLKRMAMPSKPDVIKCVVHVLYRISKENISDAQIKSQIDVLNKDFRAANADVSKVPDVWKGLVADSMVEFELATKTPTGGSTDGITRTKVEVESFPFDDSMKSTSTGGVDPWNTKKYLNIWVCTLGDGLLGYAQFPGGPANTDGVVILNTAFGTKGSANAPFNKGRTTTHEVGHFLNLFHIWGDVDGCSGSDSNPDTPNAETAIYCTPSFPHISCAN